MSDEAKSKLLPGMAAIAIWMIMLSLIVLIGVTTHKLPLFSLVFCAAFAAAGQGLLARRRWGWAMTMAAVILMATWALWVTMKSHQLVELGLGLVNLVFFLYLVRPEVRSKLR